MRILPDLFELRLDCLPNLHKSQLARLSRPLIVTARHPQEGGKHVRMSRRDLLLTFLDWAKFVDVELRSLEELSEIWQEARRRKIGRICSFHDFKQTPGFGVLRQRFRRAEKSGADIFKIVARADSTKDLLALLRFLSTTSACCAMATGRFGPISRLLFPECGSRLVYAPLRRTFHEGQLTLEQLWRLRDSYAKK